MRFHLVRSQTVKRESHEPADSSPLSLEKSSGTVSEKCTQFPALPTVRTTESFGSDDTSRDTSRREGSTISQWAHKRRIMCCGSVAHFWAWLIGFLSLTSSAIVIWVEVRHA